MPREVPPVLRAIEGLRQFSGRTVAVIGPPASGKSGRLDELAALSEQVAARVVRVKGSYRDRLVPYAGLSGLRSAPGGSEGDGTEPVGDGAFASAPMAPVAVNPDELPRAARRRPERSLTPILLGTPSRTRGADALDLATYWEELLPEFRGSEAHPVVLLVDDAAYLDPESRGFLLGLGGRARLRPLLIAVALDSTVAETGLWQEALGRGLVADSVRQPDSAPDPREVRRLREMFESLPPKTARLVGSLALLGGDVPELVLSRVARLGFVGLAHQLAPAAERGVIRARDGRIALADRAAAPILADLIPEPDRPGMHREVAEALEALSPEPSLPRRIEVAHHYLAADSGATTMARLLTAAQVSLEQLQYDTSAELLEEAFGCLVSATPAERKNMEPELRLHLAQALFYGGRPAEGEAELREGVERALELGMPGPELGTALEPLILALRAVGPRASILTTIGELAERCSAPGLYESQILLDTLATEFLVQRRLFTRAQETALRSAKLARTQTERPIQALGLLAMGLSHLDGPGRNLPEAERFLRSAHHLLSNARRWELDYMVAELEVRLVERRGDLDQARHLRETSVAVLTSEKLPSVEVAHHLGLAGIELDRGNRAGAESALERARGLVETMHLLPPSPHLLGLWLLDGRRAALAHRFDEARLFWSSLVDLPYDAVIPSVRAEALLRLAVLEQAVGRSDRSHELTAALAPDADGAALPPAWQGWSARLDDLVAGGAYGGGRILPAPPLLRRST